MENNLFVLGLDVSATQARMSEQLKQIATQLSNAQVVKVTAGLNIADSQRMIQQQLNTISKNLNVKVNLDTSTAKQQMNKVNSQISSATSNAKSNSVKIPIQTDSAKLTQQFRQIQSQIQATNQTSQGFFGNLKFQLKDALANMLKYQLAYRIIQKTIQSIKEMVNAVCELDAALVEFNKVADLSTKQLEGFTDKAYEAATKIGRTGTDMVKAATEFKRAGYDLKQSLEMGNAALVMTNVADGIDQTSDAAGTLISVLKGFNMSDADIMSVVDKMNSVSNQSPVGFDNLADGLERVSGTMSQSGNSIDETIGLLTGGFAQLRNMSKVSTGLITISQRLRAIDEDGSSIDGLSAKLDESFGSIGVSIEGTNGELRSTYDILSDYAKVYPTLTSAQKQFYAELASGKRQVNVFNAIIQQMSDVDNAVTQSVDSVGSATRENEIYRQSIAGMKNELENQFQMFANEVISSDWIKDLISAGTEFLEVLTNIAKQDTLVTGTLGVITEAMKGLASVLKFLTGNDGIASLISMFLTYKTVTKGIDFFNFIRGRNSQQNAMNAFFQSAVNGTMQVRNGFLQVGEAERAMMNMGNTQRSGLGLFRTFDSEVDKMSAKIGVLRHSFNEWGEAISTRRAKIKELTHNGVNPIEARRQTPSVLTSLGYTRASVQPQMMAIPKELSDSQAQHIAKNLNQIRDNAKNASTATQGYVNYLSRGGVTGIDKYVEANKGQVYTMQGVQQAQKQARDAAIAHNQGLQQITVGSKVATAGMKALSMALNMLAYAAIAKAISFVVETISNGAHEIEKLQAVAKETVDNFNNFNKTFNENASTISGLQGKYADLSKGVDSFGHNVSLTSEEYDEYKDIMSQVSSLMPELDMRYNAQGEAVGALTGKIKDLNAEYEKYRQQQIQDLFGKRDGLFAKYSGKFI